MIKTKKGKRNMCDNNDKKLLWTLLPDEYWERVLGPKYKEDKKAIEDFFEKYKNRIENNNISDDDKIITSTIKETNQILDGTLCRHLVNITYDNITKTYVSYCTLCGKILDIQTLNNNNNITKMLSESKITKIGKKDKNNIKKDKNNNLRK